MQKERLDQDMGILDVSREETGVVELAGTRVELSMFPKHLHSDYEP